jgi:DNA-binding transcriptional MerR regulator
MQRIEAVRDTCYKQVAEAVPTMPTAKRKHVVAQAEVVIPEKIYFRIGEVSALAKLPTYVLRFWETEFPQLRPTKSSTGQRMYRRKDVEFVMQIRKLLYEDGFTIAGARERLREEVREHRSQNPPADPLPPANQLLNQADGQVGSEARNGPQAGLPFPVPSFPVPPQRELRKEELQSLRRQLCEVLELLS